jgi:hypothetical protein
MLLNRIFIKSSKYQTKILAAFQIISIKGNQDSNFDIYKKFIQKIKPTTLNLTFLRFLLNLYNFYAQYYNNCIYGLKIIYYSRLTNLNFFL